MSSRCKWVEVEINQLTLPAPPLVYAFRTLITGFKFEGLNSFGLQCSTGELCHTLLNGLKG
jgi:hypothetical protein